MSAFWKFSYRNSDVRMISLIKLALFVLTLPSQLKNLTTPIYTESAVSVKDILPLKHSRNNDTFISFTNLLNFYQKKYDQVNISFLCHYSFLLTEKKLNVLFHFLLLILSPKFPYAHRLFLTYIAIFLCFVLILSRNIKPTKHLGNKGSSPDVFNLSSRYSKPKRMQRF